MSATDDAAMPSRRGFLHSAVALGLSRARRADDPAVGRAESAGPA